MYTRTITPNYEPIGKRERLTGFIGELRDEGGVLIHSREYSTYSQAERAMDVIVYDLLSDLCEQGLTDTLPIAA